ncbi:hypothetical protein SAMN05428936_103332 [Pelagibacterium halotolerans]|nr:hypothetical protein SAMN05428936_103332 [Pelagibacterium halotolerans]
MAAFESRSRLSKRPLWGRLRNGGFRRSLARTRQSVSGPNFACMQSALCTNILKLQEPRPFMSTARSLTASSSALSTTRSALRHPDQVGTNGTNRTNFGTNRRSSPVTSGNEEGQIEWWKQSDSPILRDAQPTQQCVHTAGVTGSIPVTPTIFQNDHAQLIFAEFGSEPVRLGDLCERA